MLEESNARKEFGNHCLPDLNTRPSFPSCSICFTVSRCIPAPPSPLSNPIPVLVLPTLHSPSLLSFSVSFSFCLHLPLFVSFYYTLPFFTFFLLLRILLSPCSSFLALLMYCFPHVMFYLIFLRFPPIAPYLPPFPFQHLHHRSSSYIDSYCPFRLLV